MNNNKIEAKILLLDIETAPALVYTWGLFDQNVGINQIVKDGYILMWAAKWLGKAEIMCDSVNIHGAPDTYDNKSEAAIAKVIWQLMDEADIVVAHNGDDFDLKWLNATFLKHHLPPVSSYKTVDTLKALRTSHRFLSNKLEFQGIKHQLGQKLNTGGFELWRDCMAGNPTAWVKMIKYCKHDVRLLERLYLKLRPFIKSHPNLGVYSNKGVQMCPNCGSQRLRSKGYDYTIKNAYRRLICFDCGKTCRDSRKLPITTVSGI